MQYEFFFVPLRGGEGEKDRGERDEMTGEGARPPCFLACGRTGASPVERWEERGRGRMREDGHLARRNRIEEGMRG